MLGDHPHHPLTHRGINLLRHLHILWTQYDAASNLGTSTASPSFRGGHPAEVWAVLGQATAFRPGRPDQAEYLEIQSASNQALVLKAFLRDSQLAVLDFWTNIDLDRFRCS